MAYAVVQVGTGATVREPIAGASADIPVGAAVVRLVDAVTLDPDAVEIRIAVPGGYDLRVTFDGTDPVAGSVGEIWFPGALFPFTRATAEKIRLVREGSDDGAVHVSQWKA